MAYHRANASNQRGVPQIGCEPHHWMTCRSSSLAFEATNYPGSSDRLRKRVYSAMATQLPSRSQTGSAMNEPRKRYRPKRDKRDTATRLADYVSSLKTNNPKLTPREIANLLEISPFYPPEAVRWSANVVTKLLADGNELDPIYLQTQK